MHTAVMSVQVMLAKSVLEQKCVKCASGRPVSGSDREVKRAIRLRDEELRIKRGGVDEK